MAVRVALPIIVIIVVVLAGLACAPALPVVTPALVGTARQRWPDAGTEDLERGRRLYVDRCSSCHSLHLPNEYPEAKWEEAIGEMQHRARLLPEEREAIRRFLLSARAVGEAPGAVP